MSAAYAIGRQESSPPIVRERALLGVCALIFTACATLTIVWCADMSAMDGMPMPGGWTMSMAWMRMPGQTWPGIAGAFLTMWVVMMAAMMMPSLLPMLSHYRKTVVEPNDMRLAGLTALVGAGYLSVWTLLGVGVFPLGVGIGALAMHLPVLARGYPIIAGAVVFFAGALQFTNWKSHHLACCREPNQRGVRLSANGCTAWQHGLRLGLHCAYCCSGPTAILLVSGVMDVRAMALVTAAITAERLAPMGQRVARGIGFVAVVAGALLIARAIGLG